MNFYVLVGVLAVICGFSYGSKQWNLFVFSLVALAATVIALVYRILGGAWSSMIYDFKCLACKRMFQKDLPMRTRHSPKCPHCRSKKVRKIIHHPAIVFVGTGWGKDKKWKTKKYHWFRIQLRLFLGGCWCWAWFTSRVSYEHLDKDEDRETGRNRVGRHAQKVRPL